MVRYLEFVEVFDEIGVCGRFGIGACFDDIGNVLENVIDFPFGRDLVSAELKYNPSEALGFVELLIVFDLTCSTAVTTSTKDATIDFDGNFLFDPCHIKSPFAWRSKAMLQSHRVLETKFEVVSRNPCVDESVTC